MKRNFFLFILACLSACATPGTQYYEGGKKSDAEMAIYSLAHGNSLWGDLTLYTIEVDGKPAGQLVKGRLSDGVSAFGDIGLLPGKHNFRVSFIGYDNLLLPTYLKVKHFQGWYDITAQLKAGKYYAALFKKVDGKATPNEICLVEVEQGGTMGGVLATRDSDNYVSCGKSNIAVSDENLETCRQFSPQPGVTPWHAESNPENCNVGK